MSAWPIFLAGMLVGALLLAFIARLLGKAAVHVPKKLVQIKVGKGALLVPEGWPPKVLESLAKAGTSGRADIVEVPDPTAIRYISLP